MCQSSVMFRMVFGSCLTLAMVLGLLWSMVMGSVSGYLIPHPTGWIDMMVSDPSTGHFYTAGEDGLVHWLPNLTIIAKVSLKSEESIDGCNINGDEFVNVTAMVLDPVHPRLLVCSTFCLGLCAVYDSSNITQRRWLNETVDGSFIRTRSVLVFIQGGDVVVGSSRDPSQFDFPILSRRQLLPLDQTFPEKMIYRTDSRRKVSVANPRNGSVFSIRFISGFERDNFTYFLIVDDADDQALSHLICIPSDTESVVPFMSIPLSCGENASYTIALSMDVNGSYFVVSFGQRATPSLLSPGQRNGSSLCQFSLKDVSNEIKKNLHFCHGTQKFSPLLDTNSSSKPCWVDGNHNGSLRVLDVQEQGFKTPRVLFVDSRLMNLFNSPNDGVVNVAFDNRTLYQVSRDNGSFSLVERDYGNNTLVIGHKLISYAHCDIQQTCEQCLTANLTLKTCVWCKGRCRSRHSCGSDACVFDTFEPHSGPRSGGTILTFSGCYLSNDTEQEAGITIGKEGDAKCKVLNSSLSSLQCKIQNLEDIDKQQEGFGDKAEPIRSALCNKLNIISNFTFEQDPEIISVNPNETIKSGGTTLTIKGSRFNIIQRPQMGMYVSGKQTENTTCTYKNGGSLMFCTTPEVNQTLDRPVDAHLYFVMDGVKKLLNLNRNNTEFKIRVYDDPSFERFNGTTPINLTDGDPLLIRGHFKGVNKDDVSVKIGFNNCSDVETNTTTISCKPVWDSSKNITEPQNVTVKIGENIEHNYGQIVLVIYIKSETTRPPTQSQNTEVILGVSIASVFVLAIFIVSAVAGFCWWVERKKTFHARLQSNETASTVYDDKMPHAYFQLQPFYQQKLSAETIQRIEDSKLFIPATNLKLGAPIGAGNFGCVYIGQLYPQSTDDEPQKVAVKTMHDSNQSLDLLSFVEEALIMKEFNHQNVLQLLGISVSENDQPMVVLPFMSNGDLLSYVSDDKNDMKISDVLKWGVDIAEGMDYLSGLKLVHRDLAARNCMLDDNLCAKVADFGLCRDIYEKGYYTSDNKKKLPIRWMAPESMERGNYSSKSDLWSLGVVLWELLTRGATPYPGVEGWDIARFLHHGRRLQQPWFCSGALYDLLLQMWSLEPSLRPSFSETAEAITTLLKTCSDRAVMSASKDDGYVKFPECCRYVELPVPQYFVLDAEPSRKPPDDEIAVAELT